MLVIALARHRPHFAREPVVAKVLIFFIRIYQKTLSRLLGNVCRFEPSCSRYAFDALKVHGAVKGTVLTTFRVARCQPFCADGHDPVPEAAGLRPEGEGLRPSPTSGGAPSAREDGLR